MEITEMQKEAYQSAVRRKKRITPFEYIEDLQNEIIELEDALNKKLSTNYNYIKYIELLELGNRDFKKRFEQDIKSTIDDEIADCIIVLLSLSEMMGIDIKQNLEAKLRYNSIRKD